MILIFNCIKYPDEDNNDVIESFWLYIFSVFPSFVYYYPKIRVYRKIENNTHIS